SAGPRRSAEVAPADSRSPLRVYAVDRSAPGQPGVRSAIQGAADRRAADARARVNRSGRWQLPVGVGGAGWARARRRAPLRPTAGPPARTPKLVRHKSD